MTIPDPFATTLSSDDAAMDWEELNIVNVLHRVKLISPHEWAQLACQITLTYDLLRAQRHKDPDA